jgi:hypothetical protein
MLLRFRGIGFVEIAALRLVVAATGEVISKAAIPRMGVSKEEVEAEELGLAFGLGGVALPPKKALKVPCFFLAGPWDEGDCRAEPLFSCEAEPGGMSGGKRGRSGSRE